MQDSLKNEIDSFKSIIVLLPVNCSFDQAAAGLSLYLSLKGSKDVSVSSSSEMIVEFNRLVGVDAVSDKFGNKDLNIKFVNYQASDIERVSYDIEGGEFKLTVVPKEGMNAPVKENVEVYYTGGDFDGAVLVGGNSREDFPQLEKGDLKIGKLVHMGTKSLQDEGIVSYSGTASCLSELAGFVIRDSGYYLDADIATNLIAGIEKETDGLRNMAVSANTFFLMSELMKAGGKRTLDNTRSESYPPGSIPTEPYSAKPVLENVVPEDVTKVDNPPADWLSPKIYKGDNVG